MPRNTENTICQSDFQLIDDLATFDRRRHGKSTRTVIDTFDGALLVSRLGTYVHLVSSSDSGAWDPRSGRRLHHHHQR